MPSKPDDPSPSAAANALGARRWPGMCPRPESLLLLLALLITAAAKYHVAREQSPLEMIFPFLQVTLPDFLFFVIVGAAFTLSYFLPFKRATARLALLLALLLLGWSVLNAVWLLTTGVQLQPGVLWVISESANQFWPLVQPHVQRHLPLVLLGLIGGVAAGVWLGWRLWKPKLPDHDGRTLARRTLTMGCLIGVLAIAHHLTLRPGAIAYSGQVIGFSSHWYAILNLRAESTFGDVETDSRRLPRVGERVLQPPRKTAGLPNVVIVLLESVPFAQTSFADPQRDQTPALTALARQGVEFRRTYVPMPQTTKAFWATFTGSTPEIRSGYAESLLTDRTYESIATILKRIGYRSTFFQMSTGTFECLPAFFHNTGFDWAWFPENLNDPSAKLSALTGDDFRMFGPMFDWVSQGSQPFLLATITSVSHDPYIVPDWFEAPAADREERFRQTVRYNDAFLAEVLRQLEERGLAENTILCVLGDHGESFRPESRRGRWAVFEELVRVPWVIRYPGRLPPGVVVDALSSQLDVTPTLLALLGFDISAAEFDGRNALDNPEEDRRLYFASWQRNSPMGFVQNSRKVVYWPATNVVFEYDLVSDPGELRPRTLDGVTREQALGDILQWQQQSHLYVEPRRFRERLIYNHWRIFSSGRTGRSMFFADPDS